jgi:hypothetical protein
MTVGNDAHLQHVTARVPQELICAIIERLVASAILMWKAPKVPRGAKLSQVLTARLVSSEYTALPSLL